MRLPDKEGDEVNKDQTCVVLEEHNDAGVHWGVSFAGIHPTDDEYIAMPDSKAAFNFAGLSYKKPFVQAIRGKMKVRVTFFCHEDGASITRVCAPMDFGPLRRSADDTACYHLWAYGRETGIYILTLKPQDIRVLTVLDEHFDPAEFITWSTSSSPWFVKRDWGDFS